MHVEPQHERFSQRRLVAGNFDESGRPVISHDPNGMTTPLHLIGGKQWGRQHSPKMVSVGMGLCSKQCGSKVFFPYGSLVLLKCTSELASRAPSSPDCPVV